MVMNMTAKRRLGDSVNTDGRLTVCLFLAVHLLMSSLLSAYLTRCYFVIAEGEDSIFNIFSPKGAWVSLFLQHLSAISIWVPAIIGALLVCLAAACRVRMPIILYLLVVPMLQFAPLAVVYVDLLKDVAVIIRLEPQSTGSDRRDG